MCSITPSRQALQELVLELLRVSCRLQEIALTLPEEGETGPHTLPTAVLLRRVLELFSGEVLGPVVEILRRSEAKAEDELRGELEILYSLLESASRENASRENAFREHRDFHRPNPDEAHV